MTIYEKQFSIIFQQKYPSLNTRQILEKLIEIGVIDFSLCKVLAVRSHVENLVKEGSKKVDAMWCASETFACSYEYIRKCMYYYTNVNIQ